MNVEEEKEASHSQLRSSGGRGVGGGSPQVLRATVRSHVVSSGTRKPRMSMTNEVVMPAEALSKLHGASVRSINILAEPTIVNPYAERVIDALLPSPAEWSSVVLCQPGEPYTLLSQPAFESLLYSVGEILKHEPTVVDVPAPAKIFGDIHGQLSALRDLFLHYSSPQHKNGDIRHINYVFLGDFVDRGPHSLEVITLLMALKVRYPSNVFLVRGNHEDRSINEEYGFLYECLLRLPTAWGISRLDAYNIWDSINEVFDLLPLAAVVGERLFCVHGGIGNNLKSVDQLRALVRPLVLDSPNLPTDVLSLVQDALWSDPSENDHMLGSHASGRGEGIFTFGPDVVHNFTKLNNLDVVVRAHQCIEAGVEAFAEGRLWTVFSAHHYMARAIYLAVQISTPGCSAAARDSFFDFDADDLGVQILISKKQDVQKNSGAMLEVSSNLHITSKIVKESPR